MKTTTNKATETTTRGAQLSTGGRYVGTTPAGTVWAAYTAEQFAVMVATFDKRYG